VKLPKTLRTIWEVFSSRDRHRIATMLKYFIVQAPLAYFWHYVLCPLEKHRWYIAQYHYGTPAMECCKYCPAKRSTKILCVLCDKEIENEEEQEWAFDNANHLGVLGPCHKKCYDKACDEEPDLPWQDPISGEVDYEAMKEDLGVIDGTEEEEELY